MTTFQTEGEAGAILNHDVTGGMTAKIETSIRIVQQTGVEVFIVQAGTSHAARALAGEMTGDTEEDKDRRRSWKGTRISLWPINERVVIDVKKDT